MDRVQRPGNKQLLKLVLKEIFGVEHLGNLGRQRIPKFTVLQWNKIKINIHSLIFKHYWMRKENIVRMYAKRFKAYFFCSFSSRCSSWPVDLSSTSGQKVTLKNIFTYWKPWTDSCSKNLRLSKIMNKILKCIDDVECSVRMSSNLWRKIVALRSILDTKGVKVSWTECSELIVWQREASWEVIQKQCIRIKSEYFTSHSMWVRCWKRDKRQE